MEKYKTYLIVIEGIFGLLIFLIIAQHFSSQKQIKQEEAIQKAYEADTPEEAIRILLKRLEEMDGNQQKSLLFSSLSTYYPSLDPPSTAKLRKPMN